MRRSLFRFVPLLGLAAVGALGLFSGSHLPGLGRSQQAAATSYQATTVKLKDNSTQIVRWNGCQRAITYRVNLSGLPADQRSSTLRTIRASFRNLAAIDGIAYRYKGRTGFVPRKGDMQEAPAEVVVAALDPASTDFTFEGDTLGVGGVLWNSWKNAAGASEVAAVRGYVVLNTKSLSGLKVSFGRGQTRGNLVQHELGHVMGLEHVRSIKNLMNAHLTKSSPNGYGPGDKLGLQAMGAQATCTSLPSSALADLN